MMTAKGSRSIRCIPGKGIECPICGRDGGCLIGPDFVVCFRVKEGCATRRDGSSVLAKEGMGWVHRITEKHSPAFAKSLSKAKSIGVPPRLKRAEIEAILKQNRTAIPPKRLANFAASMGLTVKALEEYEIGYDSDTGCWTWPMRDGALNLIGIRTRSEDGKRKGCVIGSRNGLFVPRSYEARPIAEGICEDLSPLLLILPEGPTDAAAAFDLGFRAIGRPSNNGGIALTKDLLAAGCKQDVIVFADRDETKWRGVNKDEPFWPGIEGALSLMPELNTCARRVRFVMPPRDQKIKDLRDWLRAETRADICAAIITAKTVTPAWLRAAHAKLEKDRVREKQNAQKAA